MTQEGNIAWEQATRLLVAITDSTIGVDIWVPIRDAILAALDAREDVRPRANTAMSVLADFERAFPWFNWRVRLRTLRKEDAATLLEDRRRLFEALEKLALVATWDDDFTDKHEFYGAYTPAKDLLAELRPLVKSEEARQ